MRRYVAVLWLAVTVLVAAFLSPIANALSSWVGSFDPDQVCVSSMVQEAGKPPVVNEMTCTGGGE